MKPRVFVPGQVFGRLTAVAYLGNNTALYRCSCGVDKVSNVRYVVSGNTHSCGCLQRERSATAVKLANTSHGKSYTREYSVWRSMINRCTNPCLKNYAAYGGRGIAVCKEWVAFENFYADMGTCPAGKSLDRKNNELGYFKDNCQWATPTQQSNNKRDNVLLTLGEETLNITQWSDKLALPRSLLYTRHAAGWTAEQTLTTPKRGKRK